MKLLKKGLCLSACLVLSLTMVGCTNNKDNSSAKTQQSYKDLRTKKIYNQQQALLLFTTENPAGSVISVNLTSDNGKYYYIVDGTNKKNIKKIYLIDADNGKILKKEEKGPLDKTQITGFIDFVPVMDIDKAGAKGSELLKNKDCYQLVGYDLYSENDKNIYKMFFSNGDDKNPKMEIVYLDGVSGQQIQKDQDQSTDQNESNNKSDKKIKLDKFPILENYLKENSNKKS